MIIEASQAGKRFRREWIFRGFDYTFEAGRSYAVTGANGSGKSTLLKILAGSMHPSVGTLLYRNEISGKSIEIDRVHEQLTFAAPYLELISEYSLLESLEFHSRFKPWKDGFDTAKVMELCGLSKQQDKLLKNFSSGMRQRVRLAMALLGNSNTVFLDEPTTNLDDAGRKWFHGLMGEHTEGKLLFIGSNIASEYANCDEEISLADFKAV